MSSTKSTHSESLSTILRSLKKGYFIRLIKDFFDDDNLLASKKAFTILIPTVNAARKLQDDDLCAKSKIKYAIRSHFIQGNHMSFGDKGKDSRLKTFNGEYDLRVLYSTNGKTVLSDNRDGKITISSVNPRLLPKIDGVKYSVYTIDSGFINCKRNKSKQQAKKSHKKIAGGAEDSINSCRLNIHKTVLDKFKLYLSSNEDCAHLNPYTVSVAGLLKHLEISNSKDECMKAALLMSNCSFSMFYILVQPFKTRGEFLIPNECIEAWGGAEFYPEDICNFVCKFVSDHLPAAYNGKSLLEASNTVRKNFNVTQDYKKFILDSYEGFDYPAKNLVPPEQKFYFDELKFKLCNIYCGIMKNRNNHEEVLSYNMSLIELLLPCNEINESKFLDADYKKFITRDNLLAPGSIYRFVLSTDFLGLFVNQDEVKSFQNMVDNVSEISMDNKKVFNAEAFRREVLAQDGELISKQNKVMREMYSR